MSLVDVIGWSATLVGALLGLPQLLRLIRTHSVDGLSLLAWRAVLTLNIVWLGHGLHIGQPPQVVTNLVALSLTLPLVILLARASGRSLPLVLAPSLAAAALIITVDLTLGSLAFGIAAIIPGILANAGQSVELVRSPLVSGVSPMFLLLACLNQCLWLTWALLVPDPGTIFAATLTLTMTSFNLIWFGLRRLGVRAHFIRPADVAASLSDAPALAAR